MDSASVAKRVAAVAAAERDWCERVYTVNYTNAVEVAARHPDISRATVYRLFPGGKGAILQAGLGSEITRLVGELNRQLEPLATLEEVLARAVSFSITEMREHRAFGQVPEHEWASIEKHLTFDRLDPVFAAVMGGLLAGIGILILMRHGASLGGSGVLAIYLQKTRGWRAGSVQMSIDVLILSLGLLVVSPSQVGLSILSAAALNLVIGINHRPDRYFGF